MHMGPSSVNTYFTLASRQNLLCSSIDGLRRQAGIDYIYMIYHPLVMGKINNPSVCVCTHVCAVTE